MSTHHAPSPDDAERGIEPAFVDRGDTGYLPVLSTLQIQMIAIGGAVGVGLFLGVGERLNTAGPGLVFSYLAVSVVVYLLMRALGEMVLYRPTTGAFVSYAREFVGNRFAHLTGWIYVTLGSMAGVTEIAAIAVYVQYWLPSMPGWISSLGALCVIVGSNLLAARVFGFIEFGATLIKVIAIVLFLVAGVVVVLFGSLMGTGAESGFSNLVTDGGMFPNGVWPTVVVMQGVVFSYSAIEIVGISAGEAKDSERAIPKAIRGILVRIGVFYVGSMLVLSLPTSRYSGDESPFVTALASLNVPYIDGIMNFVVLTAAISGVNATLYATVRMLRNLAANGQAPAAAVRITKRGVPVGGLLSIGAFYLAGVLLIFFAGAGEAFEIVLNYCAVCILFGWVAIFVSHIKFRQQVAQGRIRPVNFRMPGAPCTNWFCLAALGLVLVSMVFDFSSPHWYYNLIATIVLFIVHNATYEITKRRTRLRGLPDVDPADA